MSPAQDLAPPPPLPHLGDEMELGGQRQASLPQTMHCIPLEWESRDSRPHTEEHEVALWRPVVSKPHP